MLFWKRRLQRSSSSSSKSPFLYGQVCGNGGNGGRETGPRLQRLGNKKYDFAGQVNFDFRSSDKLEYFGLDSSA